MPVRRITIIQGHPDRLAAHFGHALAAAYAEGALEAGREVKRIEVAQIDFPLLRGKAAWDTPLPPGLQEAQDAIGWANHVVFFFPLWLGTMPALLKGFLEQVMRPGFAFTSTPAGPKQALLGRSARLVVTMGMPALWYRWYFLAHGVKGMERNILRFCGIGPVKENFIGRVEELKPSEREKWLARMQEFGRKAL